MTTATELRAKAADCENRAIESFDRCDTDGFMSQWAANVMAGKYRLEADLADRDGIWEFETLGRLDGTMVPCKTIKTKYGWAWGVYASFADLAKRGSIIEWVSMTISEKAMTKKGYKSIYVAAKGKVESIGDITPVHVVRPVNECHTPDNCTIVQRGTDNE